MYYEFLDFCHPHLLVSFDANKLTYDYFRPNDCFLQMISLEIQSFYSKNLHFTFIHICFEKLFALFASICLRTILFAEKCKQFLFANDLQSIPGDRSNYYIFSQILDQHNGRKKRIYIYVFRNKIGKHLSLKNSCMAFHAMW